MTRVEDRSSPHKNRAGLVRIWRALLYSFAGLACAFRTEPAFRLEVAGAAVLVPVAVALPATLVQTALLLGAVLLVLVVGGAGRLAPGGDAVHAFVGPRRSLAGIRAETDDGGSE